jgi:pantoate kinase
MFPVEPVEEIMLKIDKVEILRFYRIPDFETTVQMLENIAVKKGLVETKEVETEKKESLMVAKKNKMKKKSQPVVEVQRVPNVEQAAKRVIRDFLNNRLTYYTKVPTA